MPVPTTGPTAGARESRRIVGQYVLTGDDVRSGQRHDDVVVLGAWRLDRHPPDAAGYHHIPWTPPYDIPYRTLLPPALEISKFDTQFISGYTTLAELVASFVWLREPTSTQALGLGSGASAASTSRGGALSRAHEAMGREIQLQERSDHRRLL